MKRYFLMVWAILSVSLAFAQTEGQGLFVYRDGGLHEVFNVKEIDSIRYASVNQQEGMNPDGVMQEIWTADSVFRHLVSSIDSLSFWAPDATFSPKEGKLNTLTSESFRYYVWDYKTHPEKLVFRGERPVIVDYWAIWCKYCREMMPLMEQLAQEYKGKVDFYKIDTDHEVEVSEFLGISSLPCLYFYPKKGQPEIRVGAMDLSSMRDIIEKVLLITDDENPDAVKPEVNLDIWKGDEKHEWTDRRFTVQLKCASGNATMVKYGCFVKNDVAFSQLSDRELIQRYGEVLSEDLLPAVNSEAGMPITFRAKKKETYWFICMVKNAEGGVTVERREITTDANYVPVLDFQVERGALEENLQADGQHISFYFKSRGAVSGSYTCLLKSDYDRLLKEGNTVESILDAQGKKLNADELQQANGLGFSGVFGGLLEMTDYVCLAKAAVSNGKESSVVAEVTTPYNGYNQVIPYPEINLITSRAAGSMTCSFNCRTSDAIYGSLLMLPSDELTQLLAKGATLEEVIASHKDTYVLGNEQVEWINGQGISHVRSDVQPATRYTWIAEVRSRFGGHAVQRAEVQTLPEGVMSAPIEVNLNANMSQGVLVASATCLSANAVSASAAFVDSKVLESLLASGKTLEMLMDQPAKEFISYQTFSEEQLQWFNQNGYILGSTDFKANTRYTWIIDARTADGARLVQRSEVLTPKKK